MSANLLQTSLKRSTSLRRSSVLASSHILGGSGRISLPKLSLDRCARLSTVMDLSISRARKSRIIMNSSLDRRMTPRGSSIFICGFGRSGIGALFAASLIVSGTSGSSWEVCQKAKTKERKEKRRLSREASFATGYSVSCGTGNRDTVKGE